MTAERGTLAGLNRARLIAADQFDAGEEYRLRLALFRCGADHDDSLVVSTCNHALGELGPWARSYLVRVISEELPIERFDAQSLELLRQVLDTIGAALRMLRRVQCAAGPDRPSTVAIAGAL